MKRAVVVAMMLAAVIAACVASEKVVGTGIVDVDDQPRGGIQFSVAGTTDSTLDVVIAWSAPSSSRPINAYAVELLVKVNASPPDSLVVADTVPATQLADSATIRRAPPGDTLFVRAGVRARNDRGTWGGQGQSPIIRVVVTDSGPGIPDVNIDTLPAAVATVYVRFAGGLCVGTACAMMVGDTVRACAILLLTDGTSGLATGSPAVCEDAYARWLVEGAA